MSSAVKAFRCIVADPPWELEIGKQRTARGPAQGSAWIDPRYMARKPLPYPTLTVDEIARLAPPVARDAHLYLWTINRYVKEAYEIARAWGFKPATLLVWAKNPMGLGLGGTFCNVTEFCLFARHGNLRAKTRIDRTWFNWKRGRHSAKPQDFYDLVEAVSPGPYLEMYARHSRPGWAVWGNEVQSSLKITSKEKTRRAAG